MEANPTRLARAPHYLYAMLFSQNLDRPLPTKDGGTLRTIHDACDYITGIGKQRELRSHWQRACKLILVKEDVLTVAGHLSWPYSWMRSWMCRNSEAGYERATPIIGLCEPSRLRGGH
jgi:hypothetical protein